MKYSNDNQTSTVELAGLCEAGQRITACSSEALTPLRPDSTGPTKENSLLAIDGKALRNTTKSDLLEQPADVIAVTSRAAPICTVLRLTLILSLGIAFLCTAAVAVDAPKFLAPPELRLPTPTRVIFDSDMTTDIDDAMALAMLHALIDRNEIDLLAVTIGVWDPWAAAYVDLVDTFYKHPHIPIGMVSGGLTFEGQRVYGYHVAHYTKDIAALKKANGQPRYPRSLTGGNKVPESVPLLRRTLAAQPDGSVVMIQVGSSTNLARLLDSKPDQDSPLDGVELVRRKVRMLSAMAGGYSTNCRPACKEYNILIDTASAQRLFARWPSPIVTSGDEIGESMPFPASSIANDFCYVERHPIAESYRGWWARKADTKAKMLMQWPHDHGTYDLTSVLYAVRPDRDYFGLSRPGRIIVDPEGHNWFVAEEGGPHRYLTVTDMQKPRTLEAMVQLTSQPPHIAHQEIAASGRCFSTAGS